MSKTIKSPLKVSIRAAFSGFKQFAKLPKNIILWFVLSLFGLALINGLLQLDLIFEILSLSVPASFKLEALWDILLNTSEFPASNRVAIYILSLLFGYLLSTTVASLKIQKVLSQKNKSTKSTKSTGGAFGIIFGVLSGGCVACGTSLLGPILAAIGITTTSAALRFSLFLNILGIAVLVYSCFNASIVFNNLAIAKNSKSLN